MKKGLLFIISIVSASLFLSACSNETGKTSVTEKKKIETEIITETEISSKINNIPLLTFMDKNLEEDFIIQQLQKKIGAENEKKQIYSPKGDIIREEYVWNDFELYEGYYGTLTVSAEDTLLKYFNWKLSGYTENRGNAFYQALKECFSNNKHVKVETDAFLLIHYKLTNNGCLSVNNFIRETYFEINYTYGVDFDTLVEERNWPVE